MKSSNSPTAKNKEKIDSLFPQEGQEVTIDDFKKMVKEAEKRPFQTQEEFDRDIDELVSQEIFKKKHTILSPFSFICETKILSYEREN